nr:immunoglobulin heavy chain junction region [Macaca mulatta]MOW25548.1 immunoglobulin heavy chain junction region [Macaca mulatta]MOW26445.1 immunoglobulin heavy chain junction region [Macaca mulatta]MOW26490.1 immunoglobulin heavy chain junction region [Macaca mulatta]MOW26930.1 immunoglobulin heavy chain junction region [Macaca mulatta]
CARGIQWVQRPFDYW